MGAVIGFIYTRVFWREKLVINSWVKEAILLYAFIIHQGGYCLECVLEMRSSMHLFTYGPLYMFYITAILCFPVAMAKSAIAIFQGYLACVNLGMVDVAERKKLTAGAKKSE